MKNYLGIQDSNLRGWFFRAQKLSVNFMFCLLITLVSCQKNENGYSGKKHESENQQLIGNKRLKWPKVKVTITRGVDWPIGDGLFLPCAAGGPICNIEIDIHFGDGGGESIYSGYLTINPGQELLGYFDKTTMSKEVMSYFSSEVLYMPQERVVSETIMEELGKEEVFVIRKGEYPLNSTPSFFIVNFGRN